VLKGLLLVFVFLSLGVLIYKEFSHRNESNATDIAITNGGAKSLSGKSSPVPESQPSKEPITKQKEEAPASRTEVRSHNSKVIAYYFHGTFRCTTCRTIEKYSKEAIEYYFSNELKNGKLEFKPLNVEDAENRHYIQDYQLFSRALVISLVKQDKEVTWKNLTDVWTHVKDRDKFFRYVKDEVEKFLKET
jgi:hypothetical protein